MHCVMFDKGEHLSTMHSGISEHYYDLALETSLTFVEFENMTIGLMPGLVIIPWLL